MLGYNAQLLRDDWLVKGFKESERYQATTGALHGVPEPNPEIIEEALNSYCLLIEAVTRQGAKGVHVLDGKTNKYKGG